MAEHGLSAGLAVNVSPPAATSTGAQRFLDEVEVTWARAAEAVGGFHEARLRIAGQSVLLQSAGSALADVIVPAFAHLRLRSLQGQPLTVHLWDSESTGTAMPPPPWNAGERRFYGEIPELCGEHMYGTLHPQTKALSVVDTETDRAFFWVRSAAQLEQFDGVPPLLAILNTWLRERDVYLVHAGAIGSPRGCVLLVGKNGTGKSSGTLACLLTDLQILGDDYCAIGPGKQPTVFSLYSASKAHADTLARMPFLAPMVSNPGRPPRSKALLMLYQHRPAQVLTHAPLKGVVVSCVTRERHSAIRPAAPRAALTALAPSTIIQLPADSQATLTRLGELVGSVPCYHLDAGVEPAGVAKAIESVLAG